MQAAFETSENLTNILCAPILAHMKTATVRDLRNRYSSLLDWIGAGEEIIITRRGKTIARLVPEQAQTTESVDWAQSPAVKRKRTKATALTAEQASTIIREASGKW